jgi:uncharacterized protein YndB with AHSA1/START domain
MADINHEIKINAAPEAVYQALIDASELTKWHTSKTERVNERDGNFTTRPEEGPAFEWKVLKTDPRTIESPGQGILWARLAASTSLLLTMAALSSS